MSEQQQQQQQRVNAIVSSASAQAPQPPQSIMTTTNTLRSQTPLPQVQVMQGPMQNQTYLPQFAYTAQQQQLMLQNAVQAAMQMNQLNIMQGRPPSASPNSPGGLLSPSATSQLAAAQAAQMAAAAGNNGNLATVSMAMPVNSNGAKVTNGNKNQGIGQGQAQGQSQGQGHATMVAGKSTVLPQHSAAPLVLGQITNVFSQAGNVTPTFVTQSKGQSLAMPLHGQPQVITSQAPIRLSQPQLVTNTGQIIASQPMLTNPALLHAMANLQQVWGVTSTGQVVPHAMMENPAALQGGGNPQGIPLAAHQPMLAGQGQSPAFLAGQSLYIRTAGPLQAAQQIPGMMAASMQGFQLKGGKVQLEASIQPQQQPVQQQQQPQQQQLVGQPQQQQQIKTMAMAVTNKTATMGKAILPSTSRTPVTAKIQPSISPLTTAPTPRLNIPVVKQKARARTSTKANASVPSASNAGAAAVVMATSTSMVTGTPTSMVTGTSTSKMPAANVTANITKTIPPVTLAPTVISALSTKSQSDSEVETGKKHIPTNDSAPPIISSSITIKDSPVVPPKLQPVVDIPSKIAVTPSNKDPRPEEKEGEEDMEVTEPEKPVIAVEGVSLSVASIPNNSLSSLGVTPSVPIEKQRAIVKPHILTHVIDGFIIQEGPEPFPVQRSSLLTEFVPPKPSRSEKESEDDATEYDDQPPPLLNQSEAHFSVSEESFRKCEYCGKARLSNKFRKSGRFCSMACAKRYNISCSKRVGKYHKGSTAGKYVAKKKHQLSVKKGWRTGRGGRLAYNINMRPVSNELSSSNSGQETSSSAESPPPQQDFDVEMEAPKTDPAKWSVLEVYEFVKSLPGCQEYADEFRQQEIDGQALLLLKEDHLMTAMSIKLGPALKICARINTLREEALSSANAIGSM